MCMWRAAKLPVARRGLRGWRGEMRAAAPPPGPSTCCDLTAPGNHLRSQGQPHFRLGPSRRAPLLRRLSLCCMPRGEFYSRCLYGYWLPKEICLIFWPVFVNPVTIWHRNQMMRQIPNSVKSFSDLSPHLHFKTTIYQLIYTIYDV